MRRHTELTDTEQERIDDAKADAAAARRVDLLDRLLDPLTICDVLAHNVELRCFAVEFFARSVCLKQGELRTAALVEVANQAEREVSRS